MPDNLKVGDMRHYLKAMTRSDSKSAGGSLQPSWVYAFHFYASSDSVKSSESIANLMPSVLTTVTFSTWIRDDLKRDMRIVDGEDEYDITNVSRFFKTMDLECKRVEK